MSGENSTSTGIKFSLYAFGLTPQQGLAILDHFDEWAKNGIPDPVPDGYTRESWNSYMGQVEAAISMIGIRTADLRAALLCLIEAHGGERWDGPVTNPEPNREDGAL